MNKKKMIIIIIIAVVAISIGLYTIPPLFTNTVVEEPLPTASGFSLNAPISIYFSSEWRLMPEKLFDDRMPS